MNSLSIFNMATAILGIAVSGMLIFSEGQNRFVNRFLGIGFFAIAYRSLTFYALHQHMIQNTYLMGTVSYIYYLIPVSFYFYFRSMINDEQSFKKRDWVHFVIPVFGFLLLIYYIIAGYVLHGTFYLPVNQVLRSEGGEFFLQIPPRVHIIIIFALSFYYICVSWKLMLNKLRITKSAHPQVKKVRNWVLTLLVTCTLLILVVFSSAFLIVFMDIEIVYLVNPDIMRSLILVFIFSRVLFKPDLLYGIPRIDTQLPVIDEKPAHTAPIVPTLDKEYKSPAEENEPVQAESKLEPTPEMVAQRQTYFDSYGWIHERHVSETEINAQGSLPPIEKDKVVFYIDRINQYLLKAPYTDPGFDMKTISEALQYPLYHIEYLFRYYNQYSFPEFRNVMRVQYVLNEFQKGASHNFTVEAIGLKAGFSSRSSFFRVFKDITGQTPKQVLEELDLKKP
jgi:AraC-like DNA-binding protein